MKIILNIGLSSSIVQSTCITPDDSHSLQPLNICANPHQNSSLLTSGHLTAPT